MLKLEKLTAYTGILLLCFGILAYSQYTTTVRTNRITSTIKKSPAKPVSPFKQLEQSIANVFSPINIDSSSTPTKLLNHIINEKDLESNIASIQQTVKNLERDTTVACADPVEIKDLQNSLYKITCQLKQFRFEFLNKENSQSFSNSQLQQLQSILLDLQPTLIERFSNLQVEISNLLKTKTQNSCGPTTSPIVEAAS